MKNRIAPIALIIAMLSACASHPLHVRVSSKQEPQKRGALGGVPGGGFIPPTRIGGGGGGVGDIEGVIAGTGMTGGGTTGTVTLNADTTYLQRIVSGTCSAGSSIRAIASDGTVTCETDDNTTYTGSAGVQLVGVDFSIDSTYTQRRVSGSCTAGSSIRVIAADGTVTCETDDGLADGDKTDITVSASGATWTIDNDVVTYAKLQNVSATSRFLGRITALAGDAEELTGTQATTLLDTFSTAATTKGVVPGSNGGGATVFLNGNGGWTAPAGAGDITDVVAGVALTGGGTTGSVTLDLAFSSDFQNSADTLDLSTAVTAPGSLTVATTLGVTGNLYPNAEVIIPLATGTDNSSPGIEFVDGDDFLYDGDYINHYGFGAYNNSVTGITTYVSGYFGVDVFGGGARIASLRDATTFYGSAFAVNGNTTLAGTTTSTGLLTATAGVTTPANLTTTGTGDLVSGDALTVAGNATIGDATTDSHSVAGRLTVNETTGATFGAIDGAASVYAVDDTAFATGVGGGILFQGKYDTAGAPAGAAGIKAMKSNATDGNYGFDLVFGARAHLGAVAEGCRLYGASQILNCVGGLQENGAAVLSGTIADNTVPKGSSGNLVDSGITDDGTTVAAIRDYTFVSFDAGVGTKLFNVGRDTSLATDARNGYTVQTNANGSVYVDSKTIGAGSTIYRVGAGAEAGSARTWLTVTSSTAATSFNAPATFLSTLGVTGLLTATAGVTTPANLTTTGTGDLVSADALTVAGNATIGDSSTDTFYATGRAGIGATAVANQLLTLTNHTQQNAITKMIVVDYPLSGVITSDRYGGYITTGGIGVDNNATFLKSVALFAGGYTTKQDAGDAGVLTNVALEVDASSALAANSYAIRTLSGDNLFNDVGGISTFEGETTVLGQNFTVRDSGSTVSTVVGVSPNGNSVTLTRSAAANSGDIGLVSGTLSSVHTPGGASPIAYGVKMSVTSTRSGAGTLENRALYGSASGADTNYALYTDSGLIRLNGATSINGIISDADSDVVVGDGLNVTGAVVMDATLSVTGALNGYTQKIQAADQDVTNSAVLTDSTNLQFTTVALKTYAIDGFIAAGGSSAAGDYKYALATAAGNMDCTGTQQSVTIADAIQNTTIIATAALVTNSTSVGTRADATMGTGIRFNVVCKTVNATTLKFQFAQATATAATVARTMAGSYIRYRQLN